MIENKCYSERQEDPGHSGYCIPTVSNTKWSSSPGSTLPPLKRKISVS